MFYTFTSNNDLAIEFINKIVEKDYPEYYYNLEGRIHTDNISKNVIDDYHSISFSIDSDSNTEEKEFCSSLIKDFFDINGDSMVIGEGNEDSFKIKKGK